MATSLKVRYDAAGDILYVDLVPPYEDQDSDMIDDYTVARFNPETGGIENLEILFFTERAADGESVDLPVGLMMNLPRAG